MSPSDHYWIATVAPSGDQFCIDIVVPSGDHCCTVAVPLTHSHSLARSLARSLIWRPSRVADTPPLLPISRYGHCLFVADVCLCSEVLQPGGSWSSSGPVSM